MGNIINSKFFRRIQSKLKRKSSSFETVSNDINIDNFSIEPLEERILLSGTPISIDIAQDDAISYGSAEINSATNPEVELKSNLNGITLGGSLSDTLDGNNDTTADNLKLISANSIVINSTIGNTDPLVNLTIEAVNYVDFKSAVTIDGNLIINTSGHKDITFDSSVIVNGDLIITNADTIRFKGSLNVTGNIFLEGNEVDFDASVNSSSSIIDNANRTLTIRPTDKTLNMVIGTAPKIGGNDINYTNPSNFLEINSTELGRISQKFGKLVFGYENSTHADSTYTGTVVIGHQTSGYTFLDETYVYGKNIIVDDGNNEINILKTNDNLHLESYNDITIYNQIDSGTKTITMYSQNGEIKQVDYSGGSDDGKVAEYEFIKASTLTLNSVTGTTLNSLFVNNISATNTTLGNIALNIVDLRDGATTIVNGTSGVQDINITAISQGGTGNITLTTENGNITVDSTGTGVITTGSGNITLIANDTGTDKVLNINDVITALGGAVSLTADGNVNQTENITTTTGSISLTSTNASIIMTDTKKSQSTSGGNITYSAGNSVQLSILNTSGNVGVTATNGSITDVLLIENPNILANALTLSAKTGVGTSSADIDTTVTSLTITNSTSGDIYIQETDTLVITSITQSASTGVVNVVVDSGDITQNGVITSTSGIITLTASAGNISMANDTNTTSTAGNIIYNATNDINVSVLSTTGNVTLTADSNNDNSGKILDNLSNENANIIGNIATLSASQGIGTSSNDIDTNVTTINLTNDFSGDIFVTELNALTISGITSSGSSADTVIISDGGTITTTGTITSVSDVLIKAVGANSDIILGMAITSSTGNISLNAGRKITQNANISTSASAKTIDLVAISDIDMANNTTILTNSGNILLSGANISIETINAGTANVSITSSGNLVDIDTTSDSEIDIISSSLLLNSTGLIGTSTNHIETTVTTLSAKAGNGLFISESDGVNIDSVTVNVDRVNSDGTTTATSNTAQEFLQSTSNLVLVSNSGNIDITSGATVSSSANTLLKATSGDLSLNSAITASGNLTISSSGTFTQNSNITSSGTVDVKADVITMANVTTNANSSNIIYESTNALTLGALTTSGDISLKASLISDNNANLTNITADELRLEISGTTGTSIDVIETTIAKLSSNGGAVYLSETDNLEIGTNSTISINRVDTTATISTITDTALDGISSDDVVSIISGGSITQSKNISSSLSSATISLEALTNITMQDNTTTSSNNGNITLKATTGAIISEILNSGTANISLIAGTTINDIDENSFISATNLTIKSGSGVGTFANNLNTSITNLIVDSITTGGLYITETSSMGIDDLASGISMVGDIIVNTTGDLNLTESLTTTAGNIILTSNNGAFSTTKTINAYGNILIQSVDSGSTGTYSLTLGDNLTSTNGNITIKSDYDLVQNGNITTSTTAKTIELIALNNITTADTKAISSTNGNILLSGANISIETINAGTSSVSITSSGNLVDIDAVSDSEVDIISSSLLLNSTGTIGTATNHIETTVTTLSAKAGNGLFITETNGVNIDSVTVNVNSVNLDKTTTSTTHTAQEFLQSSGALVLVSNSGNIDITSLGTVSSNGNTLLKSGGDLILSSALNTGIGNLSISSSGTFTQNSNITSSGTVDVKANVITMTNTTTVTTNANSSNIRYEATGTLTLNTLTTTGDISLKASSVTDNNVDSTNISADELRLEIANGFGASTNTIETNITKVSSNGGSVYITEANALEVGTNSTIDINRVDATAIISTITNDALNGINSTGNVNITALSTISQTQNIVTTNNITITSSTGNIIMSDSKKAQASNGNITYSANGKIDLSIMNTSGIVTLTATNGNITDVLSGEGANILGNGTVVLTAKTGIGSSSEDIDMTISTLSATNTTNGDIYLQETNGLTINSITQNGSGVVNVLVDSGNMLLGTIQTPSNVNLTVTNGNISDNLNGENANIIANNVVISTTTGVGSSSEDINTTISNLTITNTTSGGIYIKETNDLTINSITQNGTGLVNVVNSGNVIINTINAINGNVEINAVSSINDVDGNSNITANELTLKANSLGNSTNAINTSINKLYVNPQNKDLYIDNTKALEIKTLNNEALEIEDTIFIKANGNLTLEELVKADSLVLDIAGDVNLQTQVNSLDAKANKLEITEADGVEVKNHLTSNNNLILVSNSGNITITENTDVNVIGDILLQTSENVILNSAITATNKATIKAVNLIDGNQEATIKAQELLLEVTNSVGSRTNHIETEVSKVVSTQAEIYLNEKDDIEVNISSNGNISLDVKGSLTLGSDLTSSKNIDVVALNNIIATQSIQSTNGNILLMAREGSVNLSDIEAKEVAIVSKGEITQNNDTLITTNNLLITTQEGVELSLDVDTISINANGDIILNNKNNLIVEKAISKNNNVTIISEKNVLVEYIEAQTVSLKSGKDYRILDYGNDKEVDIVATNLNMLGKGAYSSGSIRSMDELENKALDTKVENLYLANYESARVEDKIGDKNYVLMIEKNSYSLQVVNEGYVRPIINEIESDIKGEMLSVTSWHFTKEFNYGLLNSSKVINSVVESYRVINPTVEYKVSDERNTRLVEIGRLAVDDLSYMINSNSTFSFSQSIFEDEESELFQFWIEDIII